MFLFPLVARDLVSAPVCFCWFGCANSVHDRGLVERSSERGLLVAVQVAISGNQGPVFGIKVSGAYYLAMYVFPRLLSSPQSFWLVDGAPSHTAKAVVTWQKKHFPLLVEEQAAACPDLSPLDFCIWNLVEAKLRDNRASDMDTLKADISRAVTQLNSDAE